MEIQYELAFVSPHCYIISDFYFSAPSFSFPLSVVPHLLPVLCYVAVFCFFVFCFPITRGRTGRAI